MKGRAARTGPDAIALVAIEQGFPEGQRIITDDLAYRILPLSSRVSVGVFLPFRKWLVRMTEGKVPGLWAGIMARKRAIDDIVAAHPTEAVVNLGAGFDTRAYRLPELVELPVWEVDLPCNIDPKRRRLQQIFGDVPDHVTLVSIDFDHENLAAALNSHGYATAATTVFIWEGVTQYLSDEGVHATFEFLAKAAPGSRLVFTYTLKDFIDGRELYGQQYLSKKMLGKDPIWSFGIEPDEVDGLLARYGWRTVEHFGYDELGRRYVRPTGRGLGWTAIERLVHAQKLGAPGTAPGNEST